MVKAEEIRWTYATHIRPRKISNKNKLGATAVSWLGGNHNLVTNIWTEATLQQFPRVIKSNFLGGYVRECCWCYPAELTVRYDHWCWICIKLCTNKEKDSTMQLIELFDASVSCQYVSTKINGALITNIMLIQKLKPRDITISAQLARKRSGIQVSLKAEARGTFHHPGRLWRFG